MYQSPIKAKPSHLQLHHPFHSSSSKSQKNCHFHQTHKHQPNIIHPNITQHLRKYDSQDHSFHFIIDSLISSSKIKNKLQIYYQYVMAFNKFSTCLAKRYKNKQSKKQLFELSEYYKYYMEVPLIYQFVYGNLMNSYWNKKKIVFYSKIKKVLNLSVQSKRSGRRSLSKSFNSINTSNFSIVDPKQTTFYLKQFIQGQSQSSKYSEQTLRQLLKDLSHKSHQKNKNTSKILVTEFHACPNGFKKTKRGNKKLQKIFTIIGCSKQKDKNKKCKSIQSQKCQKKHSSGLKHRTRSQQNLFMNSGKKSQKSNKQIMILRTLQQRQEKQVKKSNVKIKRMKNKSVSLQRERKKEKNQMKQSNLLKESSVKEVISHLKNKIKQQKSILLKKYASSRQSYIKSSDSTCGQTMKFKK